MLPPPLGQHLHTNDFQAPAIGERPTVVPSRHSPLGVVVHKLAQHARGRLAGDETQINGALGMALACKDTAIPRAEGYHVPGPSKVVGR